MDNSDLRGALGKYLVDFIDTKMHASSLSGRVRRNLPKTIGHGGYSYGSRPPAEAIALLTLAKLDGSFDIKQSENDPITYNPETEKGIGEHRWTMNNVLEKLKQQHVARPVDPHYEAFLEKVRSRKGQI